MRPDLDLRIDLQTRQLWRQFGRSQNRKGGCSPASLKRTNDGIDFDHSRYLGLPAFIVTTHLEFFERLNDLQPTQKAWFWEAEALTKAFERSEYPAPLGAT